MKILRIIARDEQGATAIEYGLIAALIAVSAIVAMQNVGNSLNSTFSYVSNVMIDYTPGDPSPPGGGL